MTASNEAPRHSVLIIEDSATDAALIASIVDRCQGLSFQASHLEEAAMTMNAVKIDLITLDIDLGHEMNGLEIYQRLQSQIANLKNKVRCIVISGSPLSPSFRQDCRDQGVEQFLQKPFAADKLIQAIQNQIGLAQ